MIINNLKSQINNTSFGNYKIPRYLYHLTNKQNYSYMIQDKVIKPNNREVFGYGIFTIELVNFFKRWKDNIFDKNHSLAEELIKHAAKGCNELVLLKIPAENLNKESLVVRSQNRLHNFMENSFVNMAIHQAKMDANENYYGFSNPIERADFARKILFELCGKHKVADAYHCIFGDNANKSTLYKKRKEAVEYVYRECIPLKDCEKIGEVNIDELKKSKDYDNKKPIKSIFAAMLKGTPEAKSVEFINF